MGLDDDLFENNIISNEVKDTSSEEVDDTKIFSDSPEIKKFIEGLKFHLSDVDNFSFVLYTKTFYVLIDHINYIFKNLFDPRIIHFVTPLKNYDQRFLWLIQNGKINIVNKIVECERLIVASTYYSQIIGHTLAQLENEPHLQETDSYLSYTYNHFQKELIISNNNLSHVLETYLQIIESNDVLQDNKIVEYGIFSNLSTAERDLYGGHIHAFAFEDMGEVSDADKLRDEYVHSLAKMISEFVLSIQTVLDQIKAGDSSGFNSVFKHYD